MLASLVDVKVGECLQVLHDELLDCFSVAGVILLEQPGEVNK